MEGILGGGLLGWGVREGPALFAHPVLAGQTTGGTWVPVYQMHRCLVHQTFRQPAARNIGPGPWSSRDQRPETFERFQSSFQSF
jgi:hypothetical protein